MSWQEKKSITKHTGPQKFCQETVLVRRRSSVNRDWYNRDKKIAYHWKEYMYLKSMFLEESDEYMIDFHHSWILCWEFAYSKIYLYSPKLLCVQSLGMFGEWQNFDLIDTYVPRWGWIRQEALSSWSHSQRQLVSSSQSTWCQVFHIFVGGFYV